METPFFSPRDFGKSAQDYATYRKGFPDSFFTRLARAGIGRAGQRILDVGTGTGTLARGFAKQGAEVTGLDLSPELMEQARALGEREGVQVRYVPGKAEATFLESESFDVITAGQCWHWFDGAVAAKECMRLLRPGGLLAICHLCYLLQPGNVSERTEKLILQYNPAWPLAGSDGRYEKWREHMEPAGFRGVRTCFYDEDISFTHVEWRGRIRACNGVIALQDPARIKTFDEELARTLEKDFPSEPLQIPHRIFVIMGTREK